MKEHYKRFSLAGCTVKTTKVGEPLRRTIPEDTAKDDDISLKIFFYADIVTCISWIYLSQILILGNGRSDCSSQS